MNNNKTVLALSIPLAVLIAVVSCIGLFTADFYFRETANWQAQSLGQDLIDLFLVVPSLIITAYFAYRKNKSAVLLWGGVLLYLFYTFVIYCFDIHFNRLFIFYCAILGLLFYSLLYFVFSQVKQPTVNVFSRTLITRVTGIYFLAISCLFYFFWLSEVIPAVIQNVTPKTLVEVGLPTNPVHVLDLSVVLPGIFITGILLLRKKHSGFILAPVILTFFILMDITIGTLIVVMKQKGLEAELSIAFVMWFLAVISGVLLYLFCKTEKKLKP